MRYVRLKRNLKYTEKAAVGSYIMVEVWGDMAVSAIIEIHLKFKCTTSKIKSYLKNLLNLKNFSSWNFLATK